MPSASEDVPDLGDLVNALLAAAISISHSMDLLRELSTRSTRADELMARTQVTDAITLLDAARQRLVDDADRLSDVASGRGTGLC